MSWQVGVKGAFVIRRGCGSKSRKLDATNCWQRRKGARRKGEGHQSLRVGSGRRLMTSCLQKASRSWLLRINANFQQQIGWNLLQILSTRRLVRRLSCA